jgi:hypothetical protein
MSFSFSDSFYTDYMRDGYVVFRSIIPPSLIADFMAEVPKARDLARTVGGDSAQRLQPLSRHDVFTKPLQDYAELPALVEAVRAVIGREDAVIGVSGRTGMFFEPLSQPYCTHWHRDITAASALQSEAEFRYASCQRFIFNQINCALLQDSSTWYVPGSDLRPDSPQELAAEPGVVPDLTDMTFEEAEAANLAYCRRMPGAACLHLHPGDFAMYRPNGWHIGNYSPNRPRATIHDTVFVPEVVQWYDGWSDRRKAAADA